MRARNLILLLLISQMIFAMEGALDVKPLLENMCSLRLLPTMSYTSVLKSSQSSDYEKGIAWMNLMYFKRAEIAFKKSGRREAEFFLRRIEALSGSSEAAGRYTSILPDTPCGKMEKLFVEFVSKKKSAGEIIGEMKRIYSSSRGDFTAFEYLYVYRHLDLVGAIKAANVHIRGIEDIVVDYDFRILKKTYYPLIILTAGMLYEYAVREIEEVFGMSVEEFLRMDPHKRDQMVFVELSFKHPKRVRTARMALEGAIDLLSYNSNDYTFLYDLKDIPSLGVTSGMSFKDFLDRLKLLVAILRTD